MKYDNHDRKHKGDIAFNYKGFEIKVECKSLQTNSIRSIEKGYVGKFQCDASDRRPITLPDGTVIETTCLLVGEFDLLAVGIFNFVKEVNGFENGDAGIGTTAKVIAGKDDVTTVKYSVEIVDFIPTKKIVYRRYDGPLAGKGEINLITLQNGTLLKRTSYYDDDLSTSTIKALSVGMEKDNLRIKSLVESINIVS